MIDIGSKMLKVTRAYEERIDELLEENTRLLKAVETIYLLLNDGHYEAAFSHARTSIKGDA